MLKRLIAAALIAAGAAAADQTADVVVYTATPAGIASAVVAARQGHETLLVEPTGRIGGLLTGGLSYTDFKSQESVTGFFREYMDRVLDFYTAKYGAGSTQVKICFRGAHAEPHVSLMILEKIVQETKHLKVLRNCSLQAVESLGLPNGRTQIAALIVLGPQGRERIAGKQFIDASYEGDLAAGAGAAYRVGRESTREYGERYAGVLFFDNGKILPGSTGAGDSHAQCANFRLIMTDEPANRLPVERPLKYQREEFVRLLPFFKSGRITEIFTESTTGILRVQRLPNGKADINDIKQAPIRLCLPGENEKWAEGSVADRAAIFERHKHYAQSLVYFLMNDPEIPEGVRAKARVWGWAKDEFEQSGNFPPALYVREGRRILGEYMFIEQDTQPASHSVRGPLHRDSIAIGDYSLNSHGHQPAGPMYPTLVEGDFGANTVPFQIPFGTILPRTIDNLQVPVAVSASHIGFSALRLEPTWTAMGHAAGLAAHLALQQQRSVHQIDLVQLQTLLHAQKQATTYAPDVTADSQYFPAVQWAALNGFLDDLVDYQTAEFRTMPRNYGLQYTAAFANHDVQVHLPLDESLRRKWLDRLPSELRAQIPAAATRGEFLMAACEASRRKTSH